MFAFFYAVSGNIFDEVFKYINIPFFLLFLSVSYYIFKEYFSSLLSLLGIIVLMSFPLLEDMVFMAGLYPDFIFSFLGSIIFWILIKLINNKDKEMPLFLYVIVGLSLASSLLLKYQAIFFYLSTFFVIFSLSLKKNTKYLAIIFIYLPWLLMYLTKSSGLATNNYLVVSFFIFLLGIISILFIRNQPAKSNIESKKIIIMLAISTIGGIFILKNYLIFGRMSHSSPLHSWVEKTQVRLGYYKPISLSEILSPFVSPTISLFWFIPKIAGLYFGLVNKKYILPIFLLISYFSYWTIFLGGEETRWLFTILPFISLIIIIGLKKILKKEEVMKKAIFSSILLFILSSKFVFWNLGILLYGKNEFQSMAVSLPQNKIISSASGVLARSLYDLFQKEINRFFSYGKIIIFKLTSRTDLIDSDIPLTIILGIIFYFLIIFLAKNYYRLKLSIVISFTCIFTYLYIFYSISEGNITRFSFFEQRKLFDYWGQLTYVIPYLQSHAVSTDKIISYSIPTGLSYYTNLKNYNLEYGYGLAELYPIYYETDKKVISNFLKKNNFKYILIRDLGDSKERLIKFRENTNILDIIDDEKYTRQILSVGDGNYWKLYEII